MASIRFQVVLFQLIVNIFGLLIVYTFVIKTDPAKCLPEESINAGNSSNASNPELVQLKSFANLLSEDANYPSNVNQLNQDNLSLIKYAYYRHLTPPSKEPYNLPESSDFKNGFSHLVTEIFKVKKYGTFIEAGAYDGVAASNTLYLEKYLGWTGLLVECNPVTVPYLEMKRRKAWIADVCLSPFEHPATVNFSNPTAWGPSAKIGLPADLTKYGVQTDWTQFQVQAIPLFTLLSAINLTTIDFLSLDVEGVEFDVLKTIPFESINITAICLEVDHFSGTDKTKMQHFLESKGYKLYKELSSDAIYLHASYKDLNT